MNGSSYDLNAFKSWNWAEDMLPVFRLLHRIFQNSPKLLLVLKHHVTLISLVLPLDLQLLRTWFFKVGNMHFTWYWNALIDQRERLRRELQQEQSSQNILEPILAHSGWISICYKEKLWIPLMGTKIPIFSLKSRISARSNIEMELAEIPNRSISVDSDSDSYF